MTCHLSRIARPVELLHIVVTLLFAVGGFLIGRRIGIPVPAMICFIRRISSSRLLAYRR